MENELTQTTTVSVDNAGPGRLQTASRGERAVYVGILFMVGAVAVMVFGVVASGMLA